jgi:urease accessory protein
MARGVATAIIMTMTMTTGMTTATLTDPALLELLWLASPALPVGGFSYSEGLEAAVDAGQVTHEAQASAWLLQQLALVQARSELPLAAQAHAAWVAHDAPRLAELNTWALATRDGAEPRRQCEQMGRSMAEWLRQRMADGADARLATLLALAPAPAWPLAHMLAAVRAGAPCHAALLAHGFGWAENMVQAAIKAVPLGQSAGQRMLAALAQALPEACTQAAALADDERQAFAPGLAILSARHEAQYSRLFRS